MQCLFGNIYRIIIFSCNTCSVRRKMFGTSHNSVWFRQIISLKTANPGLGNFTPIPSIFSCSFHYTPPTGVTTNINHWSKSPMNTLRRSLFCSTGSCTFHQVKIKTGSLAQWNRIDSPQTMHNVQTKHQRNT